MPATRGPKSMKTSDGAIFVQVDGPNTEPEYIGCADLADISETGGGIAELIRCFNPDGSGGWTTINYTTTPPDPVTTTLTTLIYKTRQRLDEVRGCPVNLFVHSRLSGRANQFTNYARSVILSPALVGDRTYTNLAMREDDQMSNKAFGISAFPPVYEVFKRVTSKVSIAEASALNWISFCNAARCVSDAGPAQRQCKVGFLGADSLVGSAAAKANVYYTTNYGATWTACAADPFDGGDAIVAGACFEVDDLTTRVIVARGTTGVADPAEIAYSDDFGATWTRVDVGATNGQFVQGPHGMFLLDSGNIWLVTDDGYIYKSSDGGVTWDTQDAGIATSANLYAVHFVSDKIGYAAGASGDVVRTLDGGFSWTAATAIGSDLNLTVQVLDAQRAWVGNDAGQLWFTINGGSTWEQRSFSGSGVGEVKAVALYTDLIGFMLHNNASPVGRVLGTIDGGYTWEPVTTVTNAGLNSMAICGPDDIWAVGEPSGGTGVIVKTLPAP